MKFTKISVLLCALLCSSAFAQSNSKEYTRSGSFSGDQQLSLSALDEMPSKGFRDFWKKVGDENAYNFYASKESTVPATAVFALRNEWQEWSKFSDASRFYLSGLIINHKLENRQIKFTDEQFKSKVLGLSQCMNIMYTWTKSFADRGIRTTGTVEETFALCGMARLSFTG